MIAPPPAGRRAGSAAFTPCTWARKLTRMTRSNSSAVMSSTVPQTLTARRSPTCRCARSGPPRDARARGPRHSRPRRSAPPEHVRRQPRSPRRGSGGSSLRAAQVTAAPTFAKRSALARPMPLDAPTMTTDCSDRGRPLLSALPPLTCPCVAEAECTQRQLRATLTATPGPMRYWVARNVEEWAAALTCRPPTGGRGRAGARGRACRSSAGDPEEPVPWHGPSLRAGGSLSSTVDLPVTHRPDGYWLRAPGPDSGQHQPTGTSAVCGASGTTGCARSKLRRASASSAPATCSR